MKSKKDIKFFLLQSRYEEVERLSEKGLELSKEVLGKNHPNTLKIWSNYLISLINQGKKSLAFQQFEEMEQSLFPYVKSQLYTTLQPKIRKLFLKSESSFQDAVFSFALQSKKSLLVKRVKVVSIIQQE